MDILEIYFSSLVHLAVFFLSSSMVLSFVYTGIKALVMALRSAPGIKKRMLHGLTFSCGFWMARECICLMTERSTASLFVCLTALAAFLLLWVWEQKAQ